MASEGNGAKVMDTRWNAEVRVCLLINDTDEHRSGKEISLIPEQRGSEDRPQRYRCVPARQLHSTPSVVSSALCRCVVFGPNGNRV